MIDTRTEHVHFRIQKWERENLDRFKVDTATLCRRAITKKLRELMTDPDLLINGGGEGPSASLVQSWQRIMPFVTQVLTREDYIALKNSSKKLQDLKMIVTSPVMKAEEFEYFGIFLQGEETSEKILMACVEAHLEGHL